VELRESNPGLRSAEPTLYLLQLQPHTSGTGESNPTRPRPKRGPVTEPVVPDRGPAGGALPRGRTLSYAIHCGILNTQHHRHAGVAQGRQESNLQPLVLETRALPVELHP
jgi:hypothetical protein